MKLAKVLRVGWESRQRDSCTWQGKCKPFKNKSVLQVNRINGMRFDGQTRFLVSRHAGASLAPKIRTGIAHHLVSTGSRSRLYNYPEWQRWRGAVKCTAEHREQKNKKKGVVFFSLSFQRPIFCFCFFKKLFFRREKVSFAATSSKCHPSKWIGKKNHNTLSLVLASWLIHVTGFFLFLF